MTVELEDVNFGNYSDSDDGGEDEHKRLLSAISKLDKRKRVLPSERREPSLQVSEFHLAKETSSDTNAVHLRDLAKSLSLKSSHGEIARKLKAAQRKSKTLPKPLEKPVANKIKREVAYENTKKQLDQWDPVVLRHRISDDLVFPLKSANSARLKPEEFLSPNQGATELEREIAAVLNDSPLVQREREEQEEFPLSLEEMIQRRKELARLKAQESYRHAKAHRQNKIKSKKFHRHARRERIRKQIKEFEELQQKDPEAALQRLEEIEKERVLERASLRHRSTGQWARNQAVRAKYDKESRQVLAEQLKISKDLTQKVQVESESSDEEPEIETNVTSSDNPWMSQPKTEEDVDVFLSGYREYWSKKAKEGQEDSSQNSKQQLKPTDRSEIGSFNQHDNKEIVLDSKMKAALENAVVSYSETQENGGENPPTSSKAKLSSNISSPKPASPKKKAAQTSNGSSIPSKSKSVNVKTTDLSEGQSKKGLVSSKLKNSKKRGAGTVVASGGKWIVSSMEPNTEPNTKSLDDMFEDLSDKIAEKAKKKISNLMNEIGLKKDSSKEKQKSVKSKKRKAKKQDNASLLKMKRQKQKIDVDEKLDEGTGDKANSNNPLEKLQEKIQLADSEASKSQKLPGVPELDPNKFMKTKPVQLRTELPDEITVGDEALDDSELERDAREKQLTISEAFADDDVVADFSQEKQDAIDKDKPEDISLHLPGWGDWAGHNMKVNNRKRKRFIVKLPDAPPRRDENKGNLIINESEDLAARVHQVSDLPFPFTSVKDFEASVRAPISNTFIPESAHRKLIKPAVRTKMGAVIDPIDKEVLVKRQKKNK